MIKNTKLLLHPLQKELLVKAGNVLAKCKQISIKVCQKMSLVSGCELPRRCPWCPAIARIKMAAFLREIDFSLPYMKNLSNNYAW